MKTPEQLAEEYSNAAEPVHVLTIKPVPQYNQAFMAGYNAAAPKWIRIGDSKPKEDDPVLICVQAEPYILIGSLIIGSKMTWFDCDAYNIPIERVTHWMPLPQKPIVEGEK